MSDKFTNKVFFSRIFLSSFPLVVIILIVTWYIYVGPHVSEVQKVVAPRRLAPRKDLSWQKLFGLLFNFEIGRILSLMTDII